MKRLMKDTTVYLKIEDQLVAYKEKRGLFGYRGSLSTYLTRPPGILLSSFVIIVIVFILYKLHYLLTFL